MITELGFSCRATRCFQDWSATGTLSRMRVETTTSLLVKAIFSETSGF